MVCRTLGILTYSGDFPNIYSTVLLDKQFGDYYYTLIPKYKNALKQRYAAHLTVIRLNKEVLRQHEYGQFWGKYANERIEIEYNNEIQEGALYFYLNAYSPRLGKIRQELGLPEFRMGFSSYHITIGNTKNKGVKS